MTEWLRRRKIPSRLSFDLIKYILIAVVSAILFNMLVFYGVVELTGALMDQKTYYKRHIDMTVEGFQEFVTSNRVDIDDYDKIGEWNLDNWHVYLLAYRDDQVFYNTMYSDLHMMPKDRRDFNLLYRQDNSLSYRIQFEDGEGYIVVRAYFEARFQSLILVFSMAASAGFFVLIFLMLFQRKIQYISQIEKGIKILENGSLEYHIPENGGDELYSLAHSINRMSRALKDEMQSKDRIQKERSDMVTSLSHDIRTPLTSVLFYLDRINEKKYNEQQLETYSRKARDQAYHMKELMEDLFAYSMVVGEENPFKKEIYDGHELMGQLMAELSENLEMEGYQVGTSYLIEEPFKLRGDAFQLKRVFDNIGSNIKKYARKDKPVGFRLLKDGNEIVFYQENVLREPDMETESSGIGIKTCQRIAEKHGGSLQICCKDCGFYMELRLPIHFV